jgi:thioredoxin reductase
MMPVEMTIEHIERVVEAYRAAARQARDAGFDGVEIMAEVTFLVAQFLSPVYNQRQDEYGGTLENRLRFVLEVIHAVRDGVGPDRVVGIRMAGDQFVEGGLTLADVLEIVPGLEAGGDLDLLHIGAGPGAAGHIPPSYYRPGSLVYLSEAIRKVTNLPMICSQRINDPLIAEDVLARNVADLVAMNRALMADPELPIKAREGRLEDIRRCIACNECIGRFQDGLPIACTVNPEMGRETRMVITPAEQSRNVMVVGGGPAGLEAARVAALRGHRVRLFERGSELGGQTLLAARAPFRDEIGQIARYYATQLEKLQVEVHLESEVTVELVEREAPDIVIVAAGSKPLQAGIETFDGAHVVDARDVLDREIALGHRIAIVCREQHNQALSVADFLADKGHEVELITADLHAGVALEGGTRGRVYHRLLSQNVRITPLVNVSAVRGKTLEATCAITQAERAFDDFDSVVLAFGGEPDGTLGYALERKGYEVRVIGDALSPRRIIDATLEGAQAGHAI